MPIKAIQLMIGRKIDSRPQWVLIPYVAAGYARLECYQCDSTAGVTSSKYCKAEDPNLKKINRIKMPADSECYRCYKSGELYRCYKLGGCCRCYKSGGCCRCYKSGGC